MLIMSQNNKQKPSETLLKIKIKSRKALFGLKFEKIRKVF